MVEDSAGWVEIPSFAKLNLYLDVIEKRGDGYHEIVSLFQTISFHDTIRLRIVEEGFRIESTVYIPGKNLVEKAYEIFKYKTGYEFGLEVFIVKRIPVMSGFGGGSSNAGTVLKFLGEEFGVDLEDLVEMASEVGSDVPFFIEGGTAVVRGKGEIVERLEPLPEYGVVLAVPNVRMDTGKAYSILRESDFSKAPCPVEDLYRAYISLDFEGIRRCSYNVFQNVLRDYYIELDLTLKALERADPIVSMMTGSGMGCFSVFKPGEGIFHFTSPRSFSKPSRSVL